MASVLLSPRALRNLEALIETRALPASTMTRFKASIAPLAAFPAMGAPLHGRWLGYRFILGPWRWMPVIYQFDEEAEDVGIVTIQDARAAGAATSD